MDKETDELIAEFVAAEGTSRLQDWRPSWNVAPTDPVPIVREHGGKREIDLVRWGMVPPTSSSFGSGKPIINARIETVATKGMFKGAFASRRCIVPARGYFEWQLQDGGGCRRRVAGPQQTAGRPGPLASVRRDHHP